MNPYLPAFIAALIVAPAAAQQGPGAMSATPSMGDAHMPNTNMGMDSFAGVPVRNGDHGQTTAEYHALAEQGRAEAKVWATRASQGPIPETFGPQIRERLKSDLSIWREEYSVKGSDFKAMTAQWLVEPGKLSATQWAQQRAAWFEARDAWVAAHGGKR